MEVTNKVVRLIIVNKYKIIKQLSLQTVNNTNQYA